MKLACFDIGYKAYLTKPIDFAELLRTIRGLLPEDAIARMI